MAKFGPGVLTFGEAGTEIDVSCQVNSCTIEPSKDTADSTTKLCGTVKAGAVTYTYTLGGNLDLDDETAGGFFYFTQDNAGKEIAFTYTPDNATPGGTAKGTVVIDPLSFGGEEYGEDMTSDFEFDMVGKPTYEAPEAPDDGGETLAARLNARRVVNGAPPAGVKPNADGTYGPATTAPRTPAKKPAPKEKASA